MKTFILLARSWSVIVPDRTHIEVQNTDTLVLDRRAGEPNLAEQIFGSFFNLRSGIKAYIHTTCVERQSQTSMT